ncbi:MAG TPA: hypothetical protein VM487_07045 [Phycisphaerae bacterium]|nr:hypothetical protein [Phycisphaerae bacterium]
MDETRVKAQPAMDRLLCESSCTLEQIELSVRRIHERAHGAQSCAGEAPEKCAQPSYPERARALNERLVGVVGLLGEIEEVV